MNVTNGLNPADLSDDQKWLAAAARLSERGRPLSRPNPSVGAIIVKNGAVVGRGWTQAGGRPHAEAEALKIAGERAKGAVLYVTLEPCAHVSTRGPSCADLVAQSGLSRVVIGQSDPDPRTNGKGVARISEAGIAVEFQNCADCTRSLAGYFSQQSRGRPFTTLKLAQTKDGFLALPPHTPRTHHPASGWITGEIARNHVHAQRARQDAILVGAGTWRADQPRLNIRLPGLEGRNLQKFILTRAPNAPNLGDQAHDLLRDQASGLRSEQKSRQFSAQDVSAIRSPQDVHQLGSIQYLYIEGGAQTAAAFLEQDLIDRLEIYTAPFAVTPMSVPADHAPAASTSPAIALDSIAAPDSTAALASTAALDLPPPPPPPSPPPLSPPPPSTTKRDDAENSEQAKWQLTEQCQLGSDIYAAYERIRKSEGN